jgi:hypothetical protein
MAGQDMTVYGYHRSHPLRAFFSPCPAISAGLKDRNERPDRIRKHPAGMSMRSRIALITVFATVIIAMLIILDMQLADKADRLYEKAREVAVGRASSKDMQRDLQKGGVIVKADHVPADLCNTFTGGLWFSVLLPRSRRIQTEHPTVSAAGGGCTRGDSNTLIFTFSAREGHP